ncbi:dicarboxylate/amino acid:cation symporter [Desulfosporosinus metallidurans]|uniref:C4-dicarboxylate transport protein n=1 Tax=Desulfosporosinus metallidurans TaxID=1888891 RepID=A0A1Q8QPV0_9FIRM|nr:dicarboxylate/amino acid:cation symporter [Desulfosporosinus metallidurans]OLN29365.1 Aerobic C4-dicarboxylate transporter for fumarate, L-malate, D-malate, succunate [Desulfosporosinus metallidurans]
MEKQQKQRFYNVLYFRVLFAIVIGIFLGYFYPGLGTKMKPLGDGFIQLIKMLIAPIIFTTVVVGIASMGDMKKVGRVGLKAIVYFEIVSSIALVLGLIVVNIYQPGVGINANPATLDVKSIASYTTAAKSLNAVDFLLNIIPNTVVDAFAKGDILQVLLFSILFGFSLSVLGEKGKPLVTFFDQLSKALFGIVGMIMKVAPIGAFGAMSFTIGKYGIHTLVSLGKLMAGVYTTSLLFIFIVLGLIARFNGFGIWKFIKYIKEEMFIVLGTSSSESVLPRMIDKMEKLGCSKSVVGLVIPTGYSFNLDGTSIYLTMAAIFIAQACNVHLSIVQQLTIVAVLMLTSKGAAAVTGGGFITLAATLASISTIPVAGLTLLLGVDRFMSEARALTNLIGNGVATIVVSKWEKEFDAERAELIFNGTTVEDFPAGVKTESI